MTYRARDVTIEIRDPEIEAMLRRMADERGLTPEELVAQLAEDVAQRRAYETWLSAFWQKLGKAPPPPSEPLPKSFFDELSE